MSGRHCLLQRHSSLVDELAVKQRRARCLLRSLDAQSRKWDSFLHPIAVHADYTKVMSALGLRDTSVLLLWDKMEKQRLRM